MKTQHKIHLQIISGDPKWKSEFLSDGQLLYPKLIKLRMCFVLHIPHPPPPFISGKKETQKKENPTGQAKKKQKKKPPPHLAQGLNPPLYIARSHNRGRRP